MRAGGGQDTASATPPLRPPFHGVEISSAAGVIHGFLRTRGGVYRTIDAPGASPSTATLDSTLDLMR
jgi:hypothetical protein